MKKDQQKLFLIILCFVAFMFIYYNLLLLPLRKKIVEVKKNISEESARLNKARILKEQLPQLKQETEMLRLQIEQLKQKLPTTPNIPELIKIIGKEAEYYNVKISNLTPKEINSSPKEFNEIPFSINFMTNYHNLAQFLASIAQGRRIFAAQNLQLNYSQTTQTDLNLSGTCILIAYTLK